MASLASCRTRLQNSRKRPVNDLDFAKVFAEEVLFKKARRRQSDTGYEVVVAGGSHLEIMNRKSAAKHFQDDFKQLFDPDGTLGDAHSGFFRSTTRIALRWRWNCDDSAGDVLECRRRKFCGTPIDPRSNKSSSLLCLPLWALVSFLAGEKRPLRATCCVLRETVLWNPKSSPLQSPGSILLRAWQRSNTADDNFKNITTLAVSRLHEVLFCDMGIANKPVHRRDVTSAFRFVLRHLDCRYSGCGDPAQLLTSTLGMFKAWIAAFDDTGAFLLAQDSYDGWSVRQMRDAAESLRCMGVAAEVIGPFNYPELGIARSGLAENHKSFLFVRGYCLRRGELWALRVPKPLIGGWGRLTLLRR